MYQEFNPDDLKPPPPESYGPITPLMIEHLQATKPWVRLMSIVMFISVGLIFLGAIVLLLVPTGVPGVGPAIAIGYIVMGLLYLFPAYFLHRFASSIRDLELGGGDSAMETALESQKSFWKFVGILTIVVICLYALIIAVMVLGGAASMMR